MKIVNVRIDERLIHGQVAVFWTNTLAANRIMVIDENASKNDIQKMALKMACPSGIKLSIFSPERTVERMKENPYEGENVFIVVKEPKTLITLAGLGLKFPVVNVGNMSSKAGSTQVKKTVGVTPDDVKYFRELDAMGTKFTAQMTPTDPVIDFMPLLKGL